MRNEDVPLYLQSHLDRWETDVEGFIRNNEEEEICKYAMRLGKFVIDMDTDPNDPQILDKGLMAKLALIALVQLWIPILKEGNKGSI